jgi:hypothetical protein
MIAIDVAVVAVASFGWCRPHQENDLEEYVFVRMEPLQLT